ncbi:hypothetical protein ACQKJC_24790 [Priestia koreensis]|uniref:hypothetical protein n=1 Tax=Priestia koreensis TaxID=284581 RepID=UPI003D078A04
MMTNLKRFEMETQGINIPYEEAAIYLQEAGIDPESTYDATSLTSKKKLFKAVLGVLETISNNPALMKNYTSGEDTVSYFHNNLTKRINELERKIRMMQDDESKENGNFFMLYN